MIEMIDVTLYDEAGYVVVVAMPRMDPWPRVLMWGSRVFVRERDEHKYIERQTLQVFTRAEHTAMERDRS